MPFASPTVTLFEPLEEGFLVAFDTDPRATREAASAIASLDPWQRFWIPEEHAWWIADDAISRVARRVPALAEALAAWHQRPIDVADYAGAGGRWKAWSRVRQRYMPPKVRNACTRLGVPPDTTAEQVQMARRTLARRHHPDAGGAGTAMAEVNAAADIVLDWLKRES